MRHLLSLSATILGTLILSSAAHAEGEAESESTTQLAQILSVRSCNDENAKFVLDKDGSMTLDFEAKKATRDDFCQTIVKLSVPAGYSLKPGLEARLQVGGQLYKTSDILGLSFKVQSGEKVSRISKTVSLTNESGSATPLSLAADLELPEIGRCARDPKAQEYNLSFATAARIIRAEGSTATGSLVKLALPPLVLQLIDCAK